MIDLLTGVTAAGLWGVQSIRAGRVVPPPPMLEHCDKRRQLLYATETYYEGVKLDIWRPPSPLSHRPVLVFIPGGAWMLGMRRPQGYGLMSRMVELGWVCVAVGYRTAPLYRWPQQFTDVKAALNWVRANIEAYGGDPDFVAVAGCSAGGHLASLAGLAWDAPEFDQPCLPPDAVIPIYGSYDWVDRSSRWRNFFMNFLETVVVGKTQGKNEDLFALSSPNTHVRYDAPPFLIIHGENDRLIPVKEARDFHYNLSTVSRHYVEYHEVPVGHAFDLLHARHTASTIGVIENFLTQIRQTNMAMEDSYAIS